MPELSTPSGRNRQPPSPSAPSPLEPVVPLHAALQRVPEFAAWVNSSPPPPRPASHFLFCCGVPDPKAIAFAEGHHLYCKLVRPVNGAFVVQHNTALELQLKAERRPLKKVFHKQKATKSFCTPQLAKAVFATGCYGQILDPVTDNWVCAACRDCARNQLKRTSKKSKLQRKLTLVELTAAALDEEETGGATTHLSQYTHLSKRRVDAFSRVKKSCLSVEEKLIRGQNEIALRHKGRRKAAASVKKIAKLASIMKDMKAALREAHSSVKGLAGQLAKFTEQYEPICAEQSAALRTVVGDSAVQAKLFEMLKGSPVALVRSPPHCCVVSVRRRCSQCMAAAAAAAAAADVSRAGPVRCLIGAVHGPHQVRRADGEADHAMASIGHPVVAVHLPARQHRGMGRAARGV